MVKLIKKPPGYAGLASVYAYNDDTWIQVAIEATAGPDSTGTGYTEDVYDGTPTGGSRTRQQIRNEAAEIVPEAMSFAVGAYQGARYGSSLGPVGTLAGAVGGGLTALFFHEAIEHGAPPIQDAIRGTGPDEEKPPEAETEEEKKQKSTTGN